MTMQEALKQYKKNMKYLKKERPDLYEAFKQPRYDDNFHIKFTIENNQPALYIDGQKFMHQSSKLVETFFPQLQKRLQKRQIDVSINYDSKYWQDSLHFESLRAIESFYKKNKEDNPVVSKHFPIFVVYGAGLGEHIQKLLKNFYIYNLIIADRDIELIKPLLYTLDWEELFKNTHIEIATGRDYKELFENIYKAIEKSNALFKHHLESYVLYDSELFIKAQKELEEKRYSLGSNWGFFDDEYVALEHTLKNIEFNPKFHIKSPKKLIEETPAFVVGSGPSLDESIEKIIKYKDRAVIFSCGTALKPLIKAGIWPDYEFILERTKPPYDALKKTLDEDSLKKLKIIAVNLAYPKIFEPVKNRYMTLRGHDSGSLLFPWQYRLLYNLAPTVTNFAFSFALHSGFKHIYLFGVDLGVIEGKHHSKNSVYYEDKDFDIKKKYPIELEGNIPGTKVMTDNILLQTKNTFEKSIKMFPNRYVYNCSLGAKIEKAYFIDPKELELAFESDKYEAINSIESLFEDNVFDDSFKKEIYKNFNELLHHIAVLHRYLKYLFFNIKDEKEIYIKVNRFYKKITSYQQKHEGASILFQAMSFHMVSYFLMTLYSIESEKRIIYFKEGVKIIYDYLEKMIKNLQEL